MTDQVAKRNPVEALCLTYQDKLQGALKNTPVQFEPFVAAVMADCVKNRDLMLAAQAAPETMIEALLVSANAGLLPGSAHGQFYLIPRWNGKLQRKEVTHITGYHGLCDVAYRHPRVHSVEAFCVYEDEPFEWSPATHAVKHTYRMDIDRSDDKIVAAYAIARLTPPQSQHVVDEPIVCVMTRKEIDAIRARSGAATKGFSPWQSDYERMARKTVLRRLLNSGSVPRQHVLTELMARDFEAERKSFDPEPAIPIPETPEGETRTQEMARKLGVEIPTEQETEDDPDEYYRSRGHGSVDDEPEA